MLKARLIISLCGRHCQSVKDELALIYNTVTTIVVDNSAYAAIIGEYIGSRMGTQFAVDGRAPDEEEANPGQPVLSLSATIGGSERLQ
jgi:hypothetical protein